MSRRRVLFRLAALGAAATATVALTCSTASGSFAGITGTAGSSVASAASFCTAAPTTLSSAGDAFTDEAAVSTNHQTDLDLSVRSSSAGNRRTWVRFDLPAVPARCDLVTAELRLYDRVPATGRTIDVYRGDPLGSPWTAANITWSNQPNGLGPAVGITTTSTPGWQQWVVTAHVQAQYTDGNNGFMLRDRTEGAGTTREQLYYDRQNASYAPVLVLTWG
jgi:hypothetical protein